MRIVNLNAWCGVIEGVTGYLSSLDADVLFLQEVVCAADSKSPDRLSFYSEAKNTPNQDAHLWRRMSDLMPRHHRFFTPARSGPLLHEKDGNQHFAHYGDAVFVKDNIVVTDIVSSFVHGKYINNWGGLPTPRTGHIIGVVTPSNQRLVLAATHGVYTGNGKGDDPERIAQMEEFIHRIQNVMDSGYDDVVICGDFNLLPGSQVFKMFNDAFSTKELVSEYSIKTTRTQLYDKRDHVPFADYMLISPGVKVKSFSVPTEPVVSDHCPLILDIE